MSSPVSGLTGEFAKLKFCACAGLLSPAGGGMIIFGSNGRLTSFGLMSAGLSLLGGSWYSLNFSPSYSAL
ncbi:MAG TPA: hypothetical protein PL163_21110 [Leptospiraceae bacterium]|nr:hypothetical protein [Leptospiraceae bacterium]